MLLFSEKRHIPFRASSARGLTFRVWKRGASQQSNRKKWRQQQRRNMCDKVSVSQSCLTHAENFQDTEGKEGGGGFLLRRGVFPFHASNCWSSSPIRGWTCLALPSPNSTLLKEEDPLLAGASLKRVVGLNDTRTALRPSRFRTLCVVTTLNGKHQRHQERLRSWGTTVAVSVVLNDDNIVTFFCGPPRSTQNFLRVSFSVRRSPIIMIVVVLVTCDIYCLRHPVPARQ